MNVPKRRGQLVGDVLRKICGRVSRNVATVLAPHFKTGTKDVVTHAFVFLGGTFSESLRGGGGPQMNCLYALIKRWIKRNLLLVSLINY